MTTDTRRRLAKGSITRWLNDHNLPLGNGGLHHAYGDDRFIGYQPTQYGDLVVIAWIGDPYDVPHRLEYLRCCLTADGRFTVADGRDTYGNLVVGYP